MGKYTSMIINMPKTAGRKTSLVLAVTSNKRSCTVNKRPYFFCAKPKRRNAFSTTITAPSTMMPKSIAPKLIRLPETRFIAMPVIANSMLSGMTNATINAARILPNRANKTAITNTAPSNKLVRTVSMVLSTKVVRS